MPRPKLAPLALPPPHPDNWTLQLEQTQLHRSRSPLTCSISMLSRSTTLNWSDVGSSPTYLQSKHGILKWPGKAVAGWCQATSSPCTGATNRRPCRAVHSCMGAGHCAVN